MENGSYILLCFLSVVFYCLDFWTEKASFIILVVRKHKTQKYAEVQTAQVSSWTFSPLDADSTP